eukprot:15436472-Alexandrium_andersonii.AAC.1
MPPIAPPALGEEGPRASTPPSAVEAQGLMAAGLHAAGPGGAGAASLGFLDPAFDLDSLRGG